MVVQETRSLLEGVAAPGRTWANVHKNVLTAIRFFDAARREIRPDRLNAAHGSGTGEKWKRASAARHGLSTMQRTRMGIRAKQGALEAAAYHDSLDEQGREVNSDEAWKARMRLRTHPAIAEELHRWCACTAHRPTAHETAHRTPGRRKLLMVLRSARSRAVCLRDNDPHLFQLERDCGLRGVRPSPDGSLQVSPHAIRRRRRPQVCIMCPTTLPPYHPTMH